MYIMQDLTSGQQLLSLVTYRACHIGPNYMYCLMLKHARVVLLIRAGDKIHATRPKNGSGYCVPAQDTTPTAANIAIQPNLPRSSFRIVIAFMVYFFVVYFQA